jgi:outer membrane protein assembly factor BamB
MHPERVDGISRFSRQGSRMGIAEDTVMRAGKTRNQTALRWGLGIAVMLIVAAFLWRQFSTGPAFHDKSATISTKWQFTATGPIRAALALGSDGTLYAAGEDGFLYALDSSGNLKWKFDAGPMTTAPAIGPDGTIYVSNQSERIFAINPAGMQLWAQGGGPFADKQPDWAAAAVDQDHLYTPWRGSIRAIRLDTGAFDWPTGIGFQRGGSVSILPNGIIVYPGNGRIDGADSTGRTQWQYPVMNPPLSVDMITSGRIPAGNFWLDSAIAVALDGTMYACATGSRLVALAPDGTYKWEFKTKVISTNKASPVVSVDRTIYFGGADGTLYAMNPDGTQKWATNTGGSIAAAPMVTEDETVYVANGERLVAVSPDGKILEQAALGGGVDSSPTLAPDGTVYVALRTGKILAFAGAHRGLMNSPWPKFEADLANSGRAPRF